MERNVFLCFIVNIAVLVAGFAFLHFVPYSGCSGNVKRKEFTIYNEAHRGYLCIGDVHIEHAYWVHPISDACDQTFSPNDHLVGDKRKITACSAADDMVVSFAIKNGIWLSSDNITTVTFTASDSPSIVLKEGPYAKNWECSIKTRSNARESYSPVDIICRCKDKFNYEPNCRNATSD